MTNFINNIEDHGIVRGKHRWTIHMEDENGRAAVEARGDNVIEALLDASHTFDNRRIWTAEERAKFPRLGR